MKIISLESLHYMLSKMCLQFFLPKCAYFITKNVIFLLMITLTAPILEK